MHAPVVAWISPQLDDASRATSLAQLSPAEAARHESLAPPRRDRFLAGRLLLRRLVGELADIDPASVELAAMCADCGAEHGRPSVRGSGWQVSLSHSATAVVAAAAWDTAVGIDVEPASLSDEALAAIGAVASEASVLRWTRVEAILKADGRGLRIDPVHVRIEGALGWVDDSQRRYLLSEIELAPHLRVSVAVER